MTTLQLLGVGAFLMAYYYFVLRTYNTLGFRLFSLCFFIGISVCYWWYVGYIDLKNVQQKGVATQAIVLKKSGNSLDFRFTDQAGKSVVRTQTGGISVDEFSAVSEGQPTRILYLPQADAVYLTASYQRQSRDNAYILVLPGLLFLIGVVCLIFLRKYRVHAHEGTIYEYLTDEQGNILFDDAQNTTTKTVRSYVTMTKLRQIFNR